MNETTAETFDLKTPLLLVAMPQVVDPFFHMSVVLMVHHQEEGSLGFIVNRPTGVPIAEILEGLDIPWGGDRRQTAHFGGPVRPQIGTVIYRSEDLSAAAPSQQEIYPGVRFTQNIRDLEHLAEAPPSDVRLFLGHAGWGEGQLLEEFLRNDWITAPVTDELVFGTDAKETWRQALLSVGVDPALLPSWTPGDSTVPAN